MGCRSHLINVPPMPVVLGKAGRWRARVRMCTCVRGMWFASMLSLYVVWLRGLQLSTPGRLLGQGAANVLTNRSLCNDKWWRKMPSTMDLVVDGKKPSWMSLNLALQ